MSSKQKEMEYLTTEIQNATELESMVFDKIVDTPGIAAEIQATVGRETDFGDADLGVLQMQLSQEHDTDEDDELQIKYAPDSNSKITQEEKDKNQRDEEELDQILQEIAMQKSQELEEEDEESDDNARRKRKDTNTSQHTPKRKRTDTKDKVKNITAKEKEREALRVKQKIMNNEITPTPDPNASSGGRDSTGSDDILEALNAASTPPTSDPNPDLNPVMTNTLHSASTYFMQNRDTLDGGERQRRDTRASTIRDTIILSEDGKYEYNEEETIFTKGEMKFIKNVLKSCTAENGFDLYQLMAFDGAKGTKEGCWSYIKYYVHMIKAILCGLTQIFGIIIIMVDVGTTAMQDNDSFADLCSAPDFNKEWFMILYDSNLKILAFLFSSFLAYFSIDALMGVEQGMYKKMKYAHTLKWVNVTWLRIGLSINVFVSIVAVYGSFVVIFFSDNSLDMVLNSVALFFIVELDDILVKPDDYERIHEHIMDYSHQELNADLAEKKHCIGCRRYYRCCCAKLGACFGWLYTLPFTILRYITIGACLVLPFFVGYCYKNNELEDLAE